MSRIVDINKVSGLGIALQLSKKKSRPVSDAAATLANTDYLIAYTAITAARAVTLPDASTCKNQHFIIKDESGSVTSTFKITFVGVVDGATNPDAVAAAYGVKRIYSNGSNWFSE